MLSRFIVTVSGLLLAALILAASGSSSQRATAQLKISMIGPTTVTPGKNTRYTLVLKNVSKMTFRKAELRLTPPSLIKSSAPMYKRVGNIYVLEKLDTATWSLKNFQPGHQYKVTLTMYFPVSDPRVKRILTYSFINEAVGWTPRAYANLPFTVKYAQAG